MTIDRRKYLYRIKRLEIKSWLKYLMIEGKHVVDYVLGELTTGTDITINNTVEKTFYKFDIKGNSVQDGTPASDNEVPIYSAGDNGSISEKIVNKNLFDYENSTVTGYWGNAPTKTDNGYLGGWAFYITFPSPLPAGTYTLSYKVKDADNSVTAYINAQDINNQSVAQQNIHSSNSKTFTSETDIKRLRIDNGLNCVTTLIYDIQLEEGSTATDYVAHQEQTYTIPCQQPMRSIGTVRDEFIQDTEGNWYERHNIDTTIYTGASSEAWQYYQGIVFIDNSNIKAYSENGGMLLTNYFKPPACYIAHTTRQRLHINLTNAGLSDITSVSAWKNWLSTHNLVFQFELATPVDLPCTAEQIAILENLPKSYNEQTNIYSLDVTPAYLEIQAYVKKEEVIEND